MRAPRLLAEAFQQRYRQGVRFVAQTSHVALGNLDSARELSPPGYQRRRAAGDEGDPTDRCPTGRRQGDQQQRWSPEERVPIGPGPPGTPDVHPDHASREGYSHPCDDTPASVTLGSVPPK